MTQTMSTVFLNTLSFPEVIWLRFWRTFFSQRALMQLNDGAVLPNRFLYDEGVPPENRAFTIALSHNYEDTRPNALPALIIEDSGGAQSLGLVMDQRRTDSVTPERTKSRFDQVRFTYVFHCLSKNRGESRMMAAIVASALTAFRDALLADGLNKIEPWIIGTTQPLRSDSNEDYVDTSVQVTFYTVEGWHTADVAPGTMAALDLIRVQPDVERFVRTFWTVVTPLAERFTHLAFNVVLPSAARWAHMSFEVDEPLVDDRFTLLSFDVDEALNASRFVRIKGQVSVS